MPLPIRAPSLRALLAAFPAVDPERVKLLRKVLTGEIDPTTDPATFPGACAWVQSCYHRPKLADIALYAADDLLDTAGIEGWADPDAVRHGVSYCNTGDTYATTIALITDDRGSRWYLGSWGDLAERGVCGGDR